MLVSVIGFGSLWRRRFSKEPNAPQRFSSGVFYNTTGIRISGIVRQRPKIVGYLRFHQSGGFDPHYPSRMIGRVFDCADPCVWEGANKLLFRHVLRKPEFPERFLVVFRSESIGRFQVGMPGWRSPDTWLISLSERSRAQECMLLMSPKNWVKTELGIFVLLVDRERPWLARAILAGAVSG